MTSLFVAYCLLVSPAKKIKVKSQTRQRNFFTSKISSYSAEHTKKTWFALVYSSSTLHLPALLKAHLLQAFIHLLFLKSCIVASLTIVKREEGEEVVKKE